jgi:hypothetical protein
MSTFHIDEGVLHAWLDGALDVDSGADVESVTRHLAGCAECRARLEKARASKLAVSDLLAASDAPVPPSPPFVSLEEAARENDAVAGPGAGEIPKSRSALRRRPHLRLAWAATIAVAVSAGLLARELSDRRNIDLPPGLEHEREATEAASGAEPSRRESAQELRSSEGLREAPAASPPAAVDAKAGVPERRREGDRAIPEDRAALAQAGADREEKAGRVQLEEAGAPAIMAGDRTVAGCWQKSTGAAEGLPDRIRLRESLDPEAAGSARAAEVEGEPDSGMSPAGSWEPSGADSIVVSLPGFEFRLRAEADELVGSGRRLASPGVEVGDSSNTAMRFERVPCPNP